MGNISFSLYAAFLNGTDLISGAYVLPKPAAYSEPDSLVSNEKQIFFSFFYSFPQEHYAEDLGIACAVITGTVLVSNIYEAL